MDLTSLAKQYLPAKQKSNSRGVYICCPMCTSMGESRNDTRFRGGFSQMSDGGFVYHCYNCGFATKWDYGKRISKNCMNFLRTLGVDPAMIPLNLRFGDSETNVNQQKVYDPVDFPVQSLPQGSKSFEEWAMAGQTDPLFLRAVEYVHNRGQSIFDYGKFYWTDSDYYNINNRVVIPFYFRGKIVGWTARWTDTTMPNNQTKYYSKKPKDYLFNIDLLFSDREYVFLVEGVIDAIAIKGVATLGNRLSERQIDLIKSSRKRIILVPDYSKTGNVLVEQAIENEWSVSVPRNTKNEKTGLFLWPSTKDDIAEAAKEYGRLYALESLLKSTISDPDMIRMKFQSSRL